MRISEIAFIKALDVTETNRIIPVLEAGLEIYKLKLLAEPTDETRSRISDTCVLLSFLYYRRVGHL